MPISFICFFFLSEPLTHFRSLPLLFVLKLSVKMEAAVPRAVFPAADSNDVTLQRGGKLWLNSGDKSSVLNVDVSILTGQCQTKVSCFPQNKNRISFMKAKQRGLTLKQRLNYKIQSLHFPPSVVRHVTEAEMCSFLQDNVQTFVALQSEWKLSFFYINPLIFIWLPCRNNHCPPDEFGAADFELDLFLWRD